MNRLRFLYNAAWDLSVRSGVLEVAVAEELATATAPTVTHTFAKGLSYRGVVASDWFLARHATLRRDGELDHDWTAREHDDLRQIRYLATAHNLQ